ncbi:TetR/AcrR family transcriptional regulator [Trinickia violacea]|uniref:TetR/AcrR family transcriptional regulator n=1 Tax=Trinickia violacea TaxID=2571746 RepID=A0A4P8IJQ3_9BURK|nr:TetR/AcrR family transcriptional regulator [Trinickia violacea]QCP48456.1 TetR/AcrR family transcriptional regulator [Trinickia violacea]
MNPERMTRDRRKEQTRERLLDAARQMFLEKGVAATSVEDIAGTAGYTRGAFYSNFQCKQELLVELLRRDDDKARAALHGVIEAEEGASQEAKVRACVGYGRHLMQSDTFALWMEAGLHACRDSEFREHINGFQQHKLEKMAACIRSWMQCDEHGLRPPPERLALGLVSLCDGLQLRRISNPDEVNDQVIQETLSGFLSSLFRLPLAADAGPPFPSAVGSDSAGLTEALSRTAKQISDAQR